MMQTTGGRGGNDSYSISSAVLISASSPASASAPTPPLIRLSASSKVFHLCPAPCLARTGSNPSSSAASSATSISILYSAASESSCGTRSPSEDTVSRNFDTRTRNREDSSDKVSDRCGSTTVLLSSSWPSPSVASSVDDGVTMPDDAATLMASRLASSISRNILSEADSVGCHCPSCGAPLRPFLSSRSCSRSLQLGLVLLPLLPCCPY
mmetsp:Transcript_35167/g.77057  ORF Transcript_35167/g.77057 Transcript_35167/m.77057 type:complete len:210 (+) Transcript_35167:1896-2525(+)